MTREEKAAAYNKYKNNNKNNDTAVMRNKGKVVYFGETKLTIKALEWDKANDFEDEMGRVFKNFDLLQQLGKNPNMEKILEVLFSLLREDLIALANKATDGLITYDYIKKHKATKPDVIDVVLEALSQNFGKVKNLIAQRAL